MKRIKDIEPQIYSWAKRQKLLVKRCRRPQVTMTQIPSLPSLPEIPNMGKLGTMDWGLHEGTVVPLSVADRVTRVQNHVYENLLHKSTLRLQTDIQQKMKTYATEKHDLLKQLAKLRHDMQHLGVPDKPHLRVPNKHHLGVPDKHPVPRRTQDQKPADDAFQEDGHTLPPIGDRIQIHPEHHKGIDAEEHVQMFDQEAECKFDENLDIRFSNLTLCSDLKSGPEQRLSKKNKATHVLSLPQLPQIKEEHPQPHWYSGRNSQTVEQTAQESPTVLENLKEVRDMTESCYSIPSVRDPLRSDVCIPSKPDVCIPSKSDVSVHSKQDVFVPSKSDICVHSKPQSRKVRFSDIVGIKYEASRRGSSLPQASKKCKETAKKRCERLSEVVRARLSSGRDDWRSVYQHIKAQEERTRTLGVVLHAVRTRMRNNELQLMNSRRSRGHRRESTLCDDLLGHKEDQDKVKRTQNKQRKNLIPSQSFKRLHRRSNATRLQNYLTKLSRERRMSEWTDGEGYRLLHIATPKQQPSP